jgi:CheY-like chemotaxis protein
VPEGAGKTGLDSRRARLPFKSLQILLVEDHEDTRRVLSRLLTHFGHEVLAAENVGRALKIIVTEQPDLLLCDIGLPDGSGYDVIAQVKRKQPIKAVALTGFGTEADIRRSKEAGFDFHLVKPIDLHELQTVLNKVAV